MVCKIPLPNKILLHTTNEIKNSALYLYSCRIYANDSSHAVCCKFMPACMLSAVNGNSFELRACTAVGVSGVEGVSGAWLVALDEIIR